MDWRRKAAGNVGVGSWILLPGTIPLPMKITGITDRRDGNITFHLREPSWWAEAGLSKADLKQTYRKTQRPLIARED